MASPPPTIVPLSVVIAEGRILLAAKRAAAEGIINRHIAPPIDVEVSCPIDREVSIAIDRYAVAGTKLVSIAITINGEVSCSIGREVSVAIDDHVVSRANVSIARQISLAISAHPGVSIDHRV
jgi:hypothetical protein